MHTLAPSATSFIRTVIHYCSVAAINRCAIHNRLFNSALYLCVRLYLDVWMVWFITTGSSPQRAHTHTTTWPAVELTQTKAGNNQLKAYPTWLTCPSLAVVNIYSWTQWSTADCSCVCCVCVICSLDHTSSGHCALCVGKRKRVINQKRLSPSLSLALSLCDYIIALVLRTAHPL